MIYSSSLSSLPRVCVYPSVRETMKKNKLEEEEAEEEMDELHHENEELHLQVDKLRKENAETKAKLSAVSDDSEKLGGLKVIVFYIVHSRSAPPLYHANRTIHLILFHHFMYPCLPNNRWNYTC